MAPTVAVGAIETEFSCFAGVFHTLGHEELVFSKRHFAVAHPFLIGHPVNSIREGSRLMRPNFRDRRTSSQSRSGFTLVDWGDRAGIDDIRARKFVAAAFTQPLAGLVLCVALPPRPCCQ